jgi:hypothetical protein
MLFRLVRAAIPQSINMRGTIVAHEPSSNASALDSKTIHSHLQDVKSSRCDTPAMDAGPVAVIVHAEVPSPVSSRLSGLDLHSRPTQQSTSVSSPPLALATKCVIYADDPMIVVVELRPSSVALSCLDCYPSLLLLIARLVTLSGPACQLPIFQELNVARQDL